MRVVWSPLAIDRIVAIAEWIAADRPAAAARLVEELFGSVERLRDFPRSGREVPELGRSDLRELIHREYRIIYRLTTERVEILTVRHSLQLLDESAIDDESAVEEGALIACRS